MSKYRVHELAKKYNLTSSTVLNVLKQNEIAATSHMSWIQVEDIDHSEQCIRDYIAHMYHFDDKKYVDSMFLKQLNVNNYRCFSELTCHFDKDYSVIVGVNGSGKTSVLDAIAVSLGSYLDGFERIASTSIKDEDAHVKLFKLGNRMDKEPQFPVSVGAEVDINRSCIHWLRSLNGLGRRNVYSTAADMINLSRILQSKVRSGDASVILPLVSYYGADRLRKQKQANAANIKNTNTSRMNAYDNCLQAYIDFKKLTEWFADMTYIQLQEGEEILELSVVKQAMEQCINYLSDQQEKCSINYVVKSREIEVRTIREGYMEQLPLSMLSDGYKSVLSMVGDIAYRMAVLNPQLQKDILCETPGIVLIDEIDLHLHPLWQKNIMEALTQIFPKVQFIVSTHSPSIIANVKKEHLLLLSDHKIYSVQDETYGVDVDSILNQVMGVDVQPKPVRELIRRFEDQLENNLDEAEKTLSLLRELIGPNAKEIVQAEINLNVERMLEAE